MKDPERADDEREQAHGDQWWRRQYSPASAATSPITMSAARVAPLASAVVNP